MRKPKVFGKFPPRSGGRNIFKDVPRQFVSARVGTDGDILRFAMLRAENGKASHGWHETT